MGVILLLLRILGVILLILVLLILIILLAPIRYRWRGRIDDPVSHSEIDPQALLKGSGGEFVITWLLHLIKVRAAYPSGEPLSVKVFGIRLPIEKFLGGGRKEEKKEEEQKEPEEKKPKKPLMEVLEELPDKIEQTVDKISSWIDLLTEPSSESAIGRVFRELGRALAHFAPGDWHLKGVLGLGDPAASAGVLQVCGFLYPVTDGRLSFDTDFLDYRFDIDTAGRGKIRLVHLVTAAVRIILDGNVRGFITRLRKGV